METHDIFERLASRYDTEDRIQLAEINAQALRKELANIPNLQDKQALDYGCGTGLIGLSLAHLFESILLVDASEQMIERVQSKIEQAHIANAQALCSDFCEELPPDINADVVFVSLVLLHVKDVRKLLERLFSILSSGGTLLVVDFDKNEKIVSDKVHNGFDQTALQQLLRDIGFSSARSYTFHEGQNLFMKQDASLFLLNATK